MLIYWIRSLEKHSPLISGLYAEKLVVLVKCSLAQNSFIVWPSRPKLLEVWVRSVYCCLSVLVLGLINVFQFLPLYVNSELT